MTASFKLAVAFATLTSPSLAILRGRAFLENGMQPEVVARTLSSVQDEWKAQADVFTECNSTSGLPGAAIVNCADAPSSFGKSCNTVVNAIIQGSGGDKDVAKEYMADVCSQRSMSGWHQAQCNSLALAVRGSMSADKNSNRLGFDTNKLCTGFWSSLLDVEKTRLAKEKADREAAEKKAAEEAAEQEKQFEEARKKEEERKKVEAAQRAKEEAQAKAAEAATKLAQKKAEAEAVQEAAKKKMEEAKAAEREQAEKAKLAAEKANKAEKAKKAAQAKAAAVKAPAAKAPAAKAAPEAKPAPAPVAAKAASVQPKAPVAKAEKAKAVAAPAKVEKAAAVAKPAAAKAVEKKH